MLVDATLKAEFPPIALPSKEYMDNAKKIWQELGLPELTPRPPYYGYSLGYWPEEAKVQASNATAGKYADNAEYCRSRAINVPRGARLMEFKERFLAESLRELRKPTSKK
jgi:4-hydroxy-3-polyprenylbenzoate decarboxylase